MRRTASVFALSILAISLSGEGLAQNVLSAGQLLDACTRANMDWISFCNGFFQATHDVAAQAGRVCTAEGITRTELVETFEAEATRLLKADPALADVGGVSLAMLILERSFPCE